MDAKKSINRSKRGGKTKAMDINKEMPIYSGIPTFMGANFINEDEIFKYDIVFLGVPIDYGATYRLGSKYAPRKLRELSSWLLMGKICMTSTRTKY